MAHIVVVTYVPLRGSLNNSLNNKEKAMLSSTYLWLAGNEGMEKKLVTTIVGYIGTTRRIHSFIPSQLGWPLETLEKYQYRWAPIKLTRENT